MPDMHEAKIITFSIYKGGTGKTTSAVNTAAALTSLGKQVLLVDLDQQASATRYVGFDPRELQYNLYHVFFQNIPASVIRQKTKFGFDLLPSSALMAAIEESLEPGDEKLLRGKLAPLQKEVNSGLSSYLKKRSRLLNGIWKKEAISQVTCGSLK